MECHPDEPMHAPLQEATRASAQPTRVERSVLPRSDPREPSSRGLAGALRFAGPEERSNLAEAWRTAGALVVVLDAITPQDRGRLREAADRAIERELDAHGAGCPGLTAWAEGDGALSDQLFRARRLGRSGIALCFGPLDALVGPSGALGPEDTTTLRLLAAATRDRPLLVALDIGARRLRAHADPVPLAPLLEPPRTPRILDTEPPSDRLRAPAVDAPASQNTAAATPAPAKDEPIAVTGDAWRAWAAALGAARGPQPLSAFERLFKESYVPLERAVARGLDDPKARHAVDEFRRGFARVYTEAFPTFAVTGKRPRMVLDAPEIAGRIARLHGARAVQLVMIDGMRWDLGRMVQRELSSRLGDAAVHAEELLLFSALPTHTPSQLDALARGLDALRDRADRAWEEEPIRGRTTEVLRRMRIGGGRDLYRLDLVEARLRAAGERARVELPAIASAVADVVARHASTVGARTLLFVFGDHGFTCDAAGAARQGGASPEEVLVPAHAFVVGAVN